MCPRLILPLFLIFGCAVGLPKPQRCVDDVILSVLGDQSGAEQQVVQIPIEPNPPHYQNGDQVVVVSQEDVQQVQDHNVAKVYVEEHTVEEHNIADLPGKDVSAEDHFVGIQTESAENGGQYVQEEQHTEDHLVQEEQQTEDHLVKEGQQTEDQLVKEVQQTEDHFVKEVQQTEDHFVKEGQQTEDHFVKEGQHKDDYLVKEVQQTEDHFVKEGQQTEDHLVKEVQQTEDHLVKEGQHKEAYLAKQGNHDEFQEGLLEEGDHPSLIKQNEQECVCVPYYLCQNGSVNTDGTGVIDIRIKPRPCEDYMDVCCENPVEDKKPIKPPSIKRQGCGFRHPAGVGFKVTGAMDNEAEFGEFPWMAAILKISTNQGESVLDYQCGGSLIHDSIVLTAAHCVKTYDPKDLIVRLGEWDTRRESEIYPHKDVRVVVSVVHPGFSSGSLWNDFALLLLEEPLPLGENIDTVCLPKSGHVPLHHECFASGWGKSDFGQEGKPQVILKKVDLPIVEDHQCESALKETRLGKFFKLHESFVCAGGVPGKDTCKGDGGGPLVCPTPDRPDMYEVTGIVAWGIGCGGDVPGIYANVAYARDWIDTELAKFDIHLE